MIPLVISKEREVKVFMKADDMKMLPALAGLGVRVP